MKVAKVKEFKLVLVNEADYSKACNGNNGNYDHY